jgi:hypothetical protein
VSQSQSALAIQPVNLNTMPPKAEGSKGLLITQRWTNPAVVNGVATYNLLAQYNSGQFTNIQSVWIDNSTNYVPVIFTCVETGQVIQIPALAQGMYPVVSAAAPVFTLALASLVLPANLRFTTRLMLFNTAQRYFQNPGGPVNQGIGQVIGNVGTVGVAWLNTAPFGPNQFFCLTGFQLALSIASGSGFISTSGVGIFLQQNGVSVWTDLFTVTAANVVGSVPYSKNVNFLQRTPPVTTADVWTIAMSAAPPGSGLWQFNIVWYYDILNLQ